MMLSSPLKRFGMDGRFHSPLLVRRLEEAALSGRNLLLSGDTGTGKELAARAFAELMGTPNAPLSLFIFNAARFASREEAASTLFGVAPRFFSGVDARMGLIEQAHGGVLFIDELHNLPIEHQRMLLRVMEDGQVARLGESTLQRVEVRFILASNAGGDTCGLASDLFARLRRVSIPPLNARIADIPQLFCALFRRTLERRGLNADEAISRLTADHMEALCLMDFSAGNVRILVDLADRLTTRIMVVTHVKEAISAVFGEQFETSIIARRQKAASGDKDLSRYEQHKDLIIATHRKNRKNLSQTERDLKSAGVGCSRRWLRVFLKKWGEKN
jgi:DNA-binding NtrC family response regulator